MKKKIIKITGYTLLVILSIIVLFTIQAYFSVESRRNKIYEYNLNDIKLAIDTTTILEGKRLVAIKDCSGCHGANLAGKVWMNDVLIGNIVAPNITKGKGGLENYSVNDWLKAIQHGLNKEGKPLMVMPSNDFSKTSSEDLTAIISYLETIPKVDHELPKSKIGILGYDLADLGVIPLFPAEIINHTNLENISTIKKEESEAFGKYIAVNCEGCHRSNLKGGPPLAPGLPTVPDITNSGNLGKWTFQQFFNTLKKGKTPEGKILNPEKMPYPSFTHLSETELKALYIYLNSLK